MVTVIPAIACCWCRKMRRQHILLSRREVCCRDGCIGIEIICHAPVLHGTISASSAAVFSNYSVHMRYVPTISITPIRQIQFIENCRVNPLRNRRATALARSRRVRINLANELRHRNVFRPCGSRRRLLCKCSSNERNRASQKNSNHALFHNALPCTPPNEATQVDTPPFSKIEWCFSIF